MVMEPFAKDEWYPIPGFPGYEITRDGRVRSWKKCRGVPLPREMKTLIDNWGRPSVTLMCPNGAQQPQLIHRLLAKVFLGLLDDQEVDHKGHNQIDPFNIRLATRQQNMRNTRKISRKCSSRFKGVHWNREKRKWQASITVNRIGKHLGYFSNEEAAAIAYNEAAKVMFGEYSCLNIVSGGGV